MCIVSPPAAVTVVKVLEQGRTSVPNDGEEFSAIAYDSKMMNYFVLIGNEIRKYNQFLNSPIVSESHAIHHCYYNNYYKYRIVMCSRKILRQVL